MAAKSAKSVNELLASSRRTSADPSSLRPLHAVTPTVPPALRELLQIPETPPPAPRRPVRTRVDGNGRRLPAGPPPPRSWLGAGQRTAARPLGSPATSRPTRDGSAESALPDVYLPSPASLIGMTLRRLAVAWDLHRVYDQHHLFFLPNHLKPALIRWVGLYHDEGVSLTDLRLVLFAPSICDDEAGPAAQEVDVVPNTDISHLDLSGSVGRSISLKELAELLEPSKKTEALDEPQDSWDAVSSVPAAPRALLPNLTHLSLALNPHHASSASWKQLLALSSRLSSITHLSLANWPDPCLTPRARCATVATPQGTSIPYGGTNIYSHSIDHDWSEALLVLRKLSRNLYALEFLDLTGCGPWFKALTMRSGHDFVDWAGSWGKITGLRLYAGWCPGEESMPSERGIYHETVEAAASAERHIRAMRAGKGRIIHVERDRQHDV
ncbi:hypothetical protein ESCO_002951 [Escovopsis weberi]|uniref:Tafazzin n=1 Tax=Escovopsis weberi TaxID=150374 RepID=A0A0M8MS69_ESCWE|nr:hypothetical protein ESCO_002951 [Escovopsis weberi]